MNLSHAYDVAPPEADAIRLLNAALDAGVTMLDTAALYGGGANERLVAKAVGHRRREFTLASKCVLDIRDGQRVLDGRPEAILATLDAALTRLGTDHIDLYYLHRLDRAVPIEDSVGALARAREAGKISSIGLSEMSAATLHRAHAVHPIAAMQTEYSPCVRNAEVAVLQACADLGTAFVAFSPVSRGLLAGSVGVAPFAKGDIRAHMPRFQQPNLAHNLQLVGRFARLAASIECTAAQLSLAWVLSRGDHVVAIPGTRSLAHVQENLGASALSLGPEVLAEIDSIFAPGAVAGNRYPPAMQAQIDTELLPEEIA